MTRIVPDSCAAFADERLRQCADDEAPLSAAFAAHLATCASCRAEVDQAHTALTDLRTALRPATLPPGFAERVSRALREQTPRRRRTHAAWLAPSALTLAAAAALFLAVRPAPPSTGTPRTVELSDDDAAVIARAYAVYRWEGAIKVASDYLADQVAELNDQVTGNNEARAVLPWGPDDDWDLPANDAGVRDRPGAAEYALCFNPIPFSGDNLCAT